MNRSVTRMTIDDAEHYTPEQRAAIIASYPPHVRDARTKGIPMLGNGAVFPIAEEQIAWDAQAIPEHWAQIGGMDFGWDHPFAAVSLAWDRDADCIYVTRCYGQREATPIIHAAAIKPWGDWLPWAWPHDGHQHEKRSGLALAPQYSEQGLNLLPEHAHMLGEQGERVVSVEASVAEMLTRMQTGRFKVARHLADWWGEFRLYHRKDGRIVKEGDDRISATRYAVMMLRHAETKPREIEFEGGASSWMT